MSGQRVQIKLPLLWSEQLLRAAEVGLAALHPGSGPPTLGHRAVARLSRAVEATQRRQTLVRP